MGFRHFRDVQREQSGRSKIVAAGGDAGYSSIAMLSIVTIAALLMATAIGVCNMLVRIEAAESDSLQAYWLACGSAAAAEKRLEANQAVQTETLSADIGHVTQSVTDDASVVTVKEVAETAHALYAVQFKFDIAAGKVLSWQEGLSV